MEAKNATPLSFSLYDDSNFKRVELLADARADLNRCYAVHDACRDGLLKCLDVLIAANADVDFVDMRPGVESARTPLSLACAMGHNHLVARLLEAGASDTGFGRTQAARTVPLWTSCLFSKEASVKEILAYTDRASRLYNSFPNSVGSLLEFFYTFAVLELQKHVDEADPDQYEFDKCLRPIIERQIAVRAEDSDDDDDSERTYAFPPPVDLDAYAAACRLPPAEETEDEREARFQRERCFGL